MPGIRIEDDDRGVWRVLDDDPAEGLAGRVLIVLAGAGFEERRLRSEAARATSVVAANGGTALCLAAGLPLAAVAGDLDSLAEETRSSLDSDLVHDSPDPETNDLEKALALVVARWGDATEVVLAAGGGVGGGRMDHALANLGPLVAEPHARISMVDGEGRLFALRRGRIVLEGLAGARLSVLPWTLHGVEVSESGVRFPLERALLRLGGRGISNQIEAAEATVEIHEGVALIWVEV
jgi:thiamine pyrophosphokinase